MLASTLDYVDGIAGKMLYGLRKAFQVLAA
jgi:hypothetical protein